MFGPQIWSDGPGYNSWPSKVEVMVQGIIPEQAKCVYTLYQKSIILLWIFFNLVSLNTEPFRRHLSYPCCSLQVKNIRWEIFHGRVRYLETLCHILKSLLKRYIKSCELLALMDCWLYTSTLYLHVMVYNCTISNECQVKWTRILD